MNTLLESTDTFLHDVPAPSAEIARLRARLEHEIARRTEAESLVRQENRALIDKQAELSLLTTIARASNEATTLAAAFFAAIKGIGEFTGWDVGHSYLINVRQSPGHISPMGIWFMSDPMRFTPFRMATEAASFHPASEIPGRVIATGKTVLITDLEDEPELHRRDAVVICGLKSVCAIPIFVARRTAAILEFFSSKPMTDNGPFLEIAPQISAQLGRVVERHWSERALRLAQMELEKKVDERTKALAQTIDELHRRMEEERRTRQDLLVRDHALQSAACGIVITDASLPDNPMIYCNPGFEKLTGYLASEVIGRNCRFLHGNDADPAAISALRESVRSGRECEVTIKNNRADGSWFWNRLRISPVRDADGAITHYVGIQEDVTERKQTEDMLRTAKDASEAANAELARAARLKDEFLAAMSHELRTPLNGILGLTESLNEGIYGALSEKQQGALTTIDESGRHLLSLINDILDLSKIEAGKLKLELAPTDAVGAARSALRFVLEAAQKKGIRVSFDAPLDLPQAIADNRRLKQMIVNLLSNATKFTPEGGSIQVRLMRDPGKPFIRIAISDTGIGISEDDKSRLFKPFSQIDSKLSRRFEGTGLGLALVRHMAELHNGTVELESQIGKGSCFTLVVPAAEEAAEVAPVAVMVPERPVEARPEIVRDRCLILIAEDNETNCHMFSDFLLAKGYDIITAKDGADAVAQIHSHRPDLVLMDIQMPNVDGLTAIRSIRSDPSIADTPIIALTALAMSGDKERCLEAGANSYLSKPVSLRNLLLRTAEVLAAAS